MLRLWRLSRPRFWFYVFGPFIVGALAGAPDPRTYLSPLALGWALFFLFPANLLIYGANDIFDYETDRRNAKKQGYELLVTPAQHRTLWRQIALFCLPFAPLLMWTPRPAWFCLAGFLFFSLFYSAPPIRAKARPILDSVFNVLYIFPGALGYFLTGGHNFSLILFGAAWLWAMAMHAYSAVPDISADREAEVPTVATFLGLRGTLIFCLVLYVLAAMFSLAVLCGWSVFLGALYVFLMARSLQAGSEAGVMRIYRVFPWINAGAGAVLWWFAVWHKPSFWP